MKRYALGFVKSLDDKRVLLLQKVRPAFMAGLYNGVGGHIEEGETPVAAMARECEEEADLRIPEQEWLLLDVLGDGKTYEVSVFYAHAEIEKASARTDEPLQIFDLDEVHRLPLAQDCREILECLGAVWPSR